MTTNDMTTNDYHWVKEPRWLFNLGEYAIKFWYDLTTEQKEDIKYLHRASATLHRIAENECNGWPTNVTEYKSRCLGCSRDYQWRSGDSQNKSICENCGGTEYKLIRFEYSIENEDWRKRDEQKKETLRKNVQAIADKHGWKIEFQGDPRGAVVKLEIDGRNMTELIT